MRLAILDSGHSFRMKVLFAFIRAVSRLPVPDAIKLNRYRSDFYGTPMKVVTQEAMRGPSAWSVGDRELMGAFVSKTNNCEVCTKTHAGVAALAYQDEAKVSAALADLETAAIEEPLRATLRMLRKLTHERAVDADDMRAVLAAGVSRQQIEDALAVCFTFNTVDRLSRTFGWYVAGPKAFKAGRSSCSRVVIGDQRRRTCSTVIDARPLAGNPTVNACIGSPNSRRDQPMVEGASCAPSLSPLQVRSGRRTRGLLRTGRTARSCPRRAIEFSK